jgi:hypothetical protein
MKTDRHIGNAHGESTRELQERGIQRFLCALFHLLASHIFKANGYLSCIFAKTSESSWHLMQKKDDAPYCEFELRMLCQMQNGICVILALSWD